VATSGWLVLAGVLIMSVAFGVWAVARIFPGDPDRRGAVPGVFCGTAGDPVPLTSSIADVPTAPPPGRER